MKDRVLRVARVGPPQGDQLVEDGAQRIDVGPLVDQLVAARLLGDMYAAVPSTTPVRVAALISSTAWSLATPKSRTLTKSVPSLRRQTEQVVRLEIPVDDTGGVGRPHAAAGLADEVGGAADRHPPFALSSAARLSPTRYSMTM